MDALALKAAVLALTLWGSASAPNANGSISPRPIAGAAPSPVLSPPLAPLTPKTSLDWQLAGGRTATAGYLCTGDRQPLDPHATPMANTSSFGRQGTFLGAALRLPF
ncbi:MAG TPA: hypothetical protein VGS12_03250 [Caulobacteraceae bacterium]|nr:hypothetical protein [Caulobacteraceae bacterium]